MSKRDVRLLLEDMLESIARIERYTSGLDFGRFSEDERTVDAVVRNLEILGEAARQIPEDIRRLIQPSPGGGWWGYGTSWCTDILLWI